MNREEKRDVEFSVGYLLQALTVAIVIWTGSEIISMGKTLEKVSASIEYFSMVVEENKTRIRELERK